jgi:vacuolar-type H+-ATPase subunit H
VSELFEDLDQQRAAGEERDAETLVRQALDLVVNAKQMPLSASVLISKEEVAELLQDALQRMPDELRQARWLLKEREDFIAEKSREADVLLEEVRVQAERMVQRTEIVRQANHVAQRILDDANEEARRLRHEVEDYADQKLASFEIVLDRTMKTVRAGREKLQVSPIPPVEIGEQGDTSLAASASSLRPSGNPGALAAPDGAGPGIGAVEDPEGFFDQDLD